MATEAALVDGFTQCLIDSFEQQQFCDGYDLASSKTRCMYRIKLADNWFRCDNCTKQHEALTACCGTTK